MAPWKIKWLDTKYEAALLITSSSSDSLNHSMTFGSRDVETLRGA